MFADLRGFTALSENKYPYDVVFILNQYLGQMSAAIEDSGGYVDKFIGDGIMAIFGMGEDASKGADAALRAAKAMGGVFKMIQQGKIGGRAILLAGPPSSGKTALAMGLAQQLGEDIPFC